MAADISSLQDLQAGEPLDMEIYADSKEAPPPPPRGQYQVRAPEVFTFGATRQNFLSARVDPIIVSSGAAEGYEIRRTSISAKPFKRGSVTVSQVGDYLRAIFGKQAPKVTSPQEQADAIEATAGRIYSIVGDWEGYCVRCKTEVKGESKFPLVDGKRDPWMDCPTADCVDDAGAHSRIKARFRVDRYVSAAS